MLYSPRNNVLYSVPLSPPDHRPDRSTLPHIAHPSPARPAPTPRPSDPPGTLDPPANFTPAPAPRNRSWSKSRSDGPNNPPVRTPSAPADPLTRPRFVRTALTPPHARVLAPHQSVGIHRPRHPTNSPAHRVPPHESQPAMSTRKKPRCKERFVCRSVTDAACPRGACACPPEDRLNFATET